MCGIAGIIGPPAADLDALLDALAHRGPDDRGWLSLRGGVSTVGRGSVQAGDVVLLHRRLSILDLSPAGAQPMATPDGNFALVFNGEIYNHVELREELQREGVAFRSRCDTEVLLHLLVRWGPAGLRRAVGMFALALLDVRRRCILLARDFFGIKPLYYTHGGGAFAFASEIKALLRLPFVRRETDAQRLYEYLRFGSTDHGEATLLAGVRQVPAGHYLEVALDRPQATEPVRYWSLDLDDRLDLSFDEAAVRLRELFLDSVRLHLRSDVPVGAALSGGIDSSAIVAAMRAVAPRAEIHAFSFVADDPALSEERWIDLAGSRAGAVIHKVRAAPEELLDDLDALVRVQDEPFGSTSIYAQYRVFREARRAGVPVMLDGQGADEMLAGYRPYLAARLASLLRQGRPVAALRFLRKAGAQSGTGGARRLLLQAGSLLCPPACKALAHRLLGEGLMPAWLDGAWFRARGVAAPPARADSPEVLREQLVRTLTTTSLPMLLRYEDRNSMAWSVESRVPFLTPELVRFVLRLPEDYLVAPDGTSKNVFRRAMRGLVPDEVLDRRDKIGFATPEQRWLTVLRPWVEATLNGERARAISALRPAALRCEWDAVLAGRKPFDFRVWRWLNLIRWVERFDVRVA
jgi:asparagine synthase (glutamine-hydrolysing)